MIFLLNSEEISEAEGNDPPAPDPSKEITCRFQIHVSSMIHEALFPYDPYTALHTS